MSKILFLILFNITILFAKYNIYEDRNIFTIKIKKQKYKELLINLKDEINFQSYTIVHELNLANSTSIVARSLKKKKVLKNGRNILICKTSFTLNMIEENIHNITFCPMVISIYEKDKTTYISYKKYNSLKKDDLTANKINKNLKELILKSLD